MSRGVDRGSFRYGVDKGITGSTVGYACQRDELNSMRIKLCIQASIIMRLVRSRVQWPRAGSAGLLHFEMACGFLSLRHQVNKLQPTSQAK
jgi:hypothetical protein